MTKKRGHREGGIDARGDNRWRLRYRVDGQRFTKAFHGSKLEATKELRRLLASGDGGVHVPPARTTLADWVTEWLALWERKVSAQTLEHYGKLLRGNVLPVLGHRPLQEIGPSELDRLYGELGKRLSPRSCHHVHRVLNCCLRVAVKKMRLVDNPAARAEAPRAKQSDAWSVLDADQLTTLVRGFKDTALYGIVCVAAYAGLRRNEILALLWTDVDFIKSTITVRRSVEETVRYGRRTKEPKTERGRREIAIDAGLLEILRAEHDQHRRIMAGVGEGAQVDLSLVRLPPEALVFPSLATPFDFTRLRRPTSVSKLSPSEPQRSASRSGCTICATVTVQFCSAGVCRSTRLPVGWAIMPRCCFRSMRTACRRRTRRAPRLSELSPKGFDTIGSKLGPAGA
jgi:integrase